MDNYEESTGSEKIIEEKFKHLSIRDDKSEMSIEHDSDDEENFEDEDENKIIFTSEEKLFLRQVREYEKNPYEQSSTEFDDSDNEEMIGYDSPEEEYEEL